MSNHTNITLQVYETDAAALNTRVLRSITERADGFATYRNQRFAVKQKLHEFYDTLARELGSEREKFYRGSEVNTLICQGDEFYFILQGGQKPNYASCSLNVWANTTQQLESVIDAVMKLAKPQIITDSMFSINWCFQAGSHGMQSVVIEEMANDVLHDEAYPTIVEQYGSVQRFIEAYLDADETVVVLQGPPGTGKTRLIRGILGELTRRKAKLGIFKQDHREDHDTSVVSASATYTGDEKVLSNDEIFVRFVTSGDDAFIVEDADHVLKPRASGNKDLHRFLMIADGVVRTQGRKIIFSSNLPNLGDLDDALVRPGRCFARVALGALTDPKPLLLKLTGDEAQAEAALQTLKPQKTYALAELYQALRRVTSK